MEITTWEWWLVLGAVAASGVCWLVLVAAVVKLWVRQRSTETMLHFLGVTVNLQTASRRLSPTAPPGFNRIPRPQLVYEDSGAPRRDDNDLTY